MAVTPLPHGQFHFGMLMLYLDRFCHGTDIHTFTDGEGRPDLAAARAFAERIRTRLSKHWEDWENMLVITQRSHQVILHALIETPPHLNGAWYRKIRAEMVATYQAEGSDTTPFASLPDQPDQP